MIIQNSHIYYLVRQNMAYNNEDEFRAFMEGLSELTDKFRSTGDWMIDERNRQARLAQKAEEEELKRQAEKKKKFDEQYSKFQKVFSGVLTSVSSVMEGKGSFTSLNSVIDLTTQVFSSLTSKIPVVGALFTAGLQAAAEAAKMMTNQFEKAYSTFEQLSDLGLVQNFEQLLDVQKQSGLNFQDLNKVLSKNSKNFTNFGSGVADGVNEFKRLVNESTAIRGEFQRLGVTSSDYNEFAIAYLERMQQAGKLQAMEDADRKKGVQEYILELDALAKLTGKSRKEIQKEREERTRDARYALAVQKMDPERRKQMDAFLDLIKVKMPGATAAFQDLIASGGVIGSEASKEGVRAYGQDILDVSRGFIDGTMKAHEGFNRMIEVSEAYVERTGELIKVKGAETTITKHAAEAVNFRTQKQLGSLEDVIAATNEQKRQQEGENASLARSRINLYSTSARLENLATSSKNAAKMIDFLSGKISQVIQALENRGVIEKTGAPLPPRGGKVAETRAAAFPGGAVEIPRDDGSIEQRLGGTPSWRNYNPGNLNYTPTTAGYGAIGKDSSGFAIFPDYATGDQARKRLLSEVYGGSTVADMIKKYAPPNDPRGKNDPAAYLRHVISSSKKNFGIDISPNDIVGDLDEKQREALLTSMKDMEGYKEGTVNIIPKAPAAGPAAGGLPVATPPSGDEAARKVNTSGASTPSMPPPVTVAAADSFADKLDDMIDALNDIKGYQKTMLQRTFA